MITSDASGYQGEKLIVYLGDYIDRGPASKQVVDRLLAQSLPGFEFIFLLGNHERALLDFLEDATAMAAWLSWGGKETLNSYGIRLPAPIHTQQIKQLAAQLSQVLPASHLSFFQALQSSHTVGSYYFVHAGIRPGVPLSKQELGDQLWIREDFTRDQQVHEAIIVHGHSITSQAELLPNRIGIDTGAFHTGVLTALVLEDGEQRLLQTGMSKLP
jgi:serine/threonine protein phosphatase 1